MKMINKRCAIVISLVTLIAILTGCGAKEAPMAYKQTEYVAETAAAAEMDYAMSTAGGFGYKNEVSFEEASETETFEPNSEERKLIRNMNVSLETEKFDLVKNSIKQSIEKFGGYIEQSYEYQGNYYSSQNRYADITARIPAENLDSFINSSFEDAYITSLNETTEDVSLRYSDLETKLKTLETERDRLMELLAAADNIESIIAIESRLSEIRYELESIHSSLKSYDNQVTYSTVWISIQEVKRVEASKEATFGERIVNGFKSSTEDLFTFLEDFTVWIISNILSILFVAVIIAIAVFLIKKLIVNRSTKKKEATEVKEEEKKDSSEKE